MASPPPRVFLNFRGAELRQSFIAHLEMALIRGGVNIYFDSGMVRGMDISDYFKGIKESQIALVILSEKYTESRWCLDELVKIVEQAQRGKLMAIPIFYKLDSSTVENLDGYFGDNLWKLFKDTPEFDKLKQWKDALRFVSTNPGFLLNEKTDESELLDDIVKQVHMALSCLPMEADGAQSRKNDDFPSETDSDATPELQDTEEPELQDTEEKKQEYVSKSSTMVPYKSSTMVPYKSSTMVTYDQMPEVFINFRGAEMRHGFVSHLQKALKMNGVSVFEDKHELRGEDLGKLFARVEKVKIAFVIFSSKYSESARCLNELVKIKELMDKGKLVAIPIFYKVKPSQVVSLEGVFGENFRRLCHMNQDHQINSKWNEALKSIARNLGFSLNKHSSESEFISHIVKEVLNIIRQQEEEKPILFGMEQRIKQLEEKLEFEGGDTQIIRVVRMPGIGKTTLAMMLHEKWKRRFLCCVSFMDIHKKSEGYGPVCLRKTLLELLLEGKDLEIGDETTHGSVKVELLKTKIFVILDDVSDKKQLEFLLDELGWIRKGSKIIITTCDMSVLEGFADDTYVVPKLNDREALYLFTSHAFHGQIHTITSNLMTLSRMFVDYARGHPLTLKLLGNELYGKDEIHWPSILEMVKIQCKMMFPNLTTKLYIYFLSYTSYLTNKLYQIALI